jgi:hypothetical protein
MPHWLLAVLAGSALLGFIGFAFWQGTKVQPDRDNPDNWTTSGGGQDSSHSGFDGHHGT